MTVASMFSLFDDVGRRGRAVGAFNVISLEHAEAIVTGAAQASRPVVLQLSENTVKYHGSLGPIGMACLRLAAEVEPQVCVHLDHATNADLVREAVALGFGSVMVDGSTLPYTDNLTFTHDLATWCHKQGVFVEAELGEIGGKDGAHAPGVRTDPGEADSFVSETGVDALAVAVGSSHAMRVREAVLDNDLITQIAAKLDVPLVLHGSSGVSDDGLSAAVDHGIRKVNVATHLNAALTAAIREVLDREDVIDPRHYLRPGRDAVARAVAHLLGVIS